MFARFIRMEPVISPGASARVYVPAVMGSRALAFLRTYLVARILGGLDAQFGAYQLALELTNPAVALVMFGAADVAERYVSRIERDGGHAGVRRWLLKQYGRLAIGALLVAGLMALLSPWLSRAVWGERQVGLAVVCAATVLVLAFYQHLAGVLRGLRFYAASAGLELFSAAFLLLFSGVAALFRNAVWLMAAYAASVVIPLLVYEFLLWRKLVKTESDAEQTAAAENSRQPLLTGNFALWAFVRMMLVMVFGGFFSLWGVRFLEQHAGGGTQQALSATGQFSWPFRIAQMLGFLAVTLWASSYGIAARAWSHGQVRRATAQFFRIGRLGMAGLSVTAVLVMWCRGIFVWILPQYASAIAALLPGLLAVFLGYSLVAFFSSLSDLRESPQRGAALWATAVFVQLAGIVAGRFGALALVGGDAKLWMMLTSALGLALALVIPAPLLLCRPMRFSATGVPLLILGCCTITFFAPGWVVDWIAGPAEIGAVLLLYSMGLLVRPMDRRAFRRWRIGRARQPAEGSEA